MSAQEDKIPGRTAYFVSYHVAFLRKRWDLYSVTRMCLWPYWLHQISRKGHAQHHTAHRTFQGSARDRSRHTVILQVSGGDGRQHGGGGVYDVYHQLLGQQIHSRRQQGAREWLDREKGGQKDGVKMCRRPPVGWNLAQPVRRSLGWADSPHLLFLSDKVGKRACA